MLHAGVTVMKAEALIADAIDRLTYAAYKEARERSPHVTPRRWKKVFGDTRALEAQYQKEKRQS